jgi:hypothetical protein
MLLMHFDKIIKFYFFVYKKIKKPRFKVDELVLINNIEYQILQVSAKLPLYSYFCMTVFNKGSGYYHESEIKKKSGLLKELE